MSRLNILISTSLFLLIIFACENESSSGLFIDEKVLLNLEIKTIEEESVKLNQIEKRKATVFLFLSPDCPIAQKYTSRYEYLYQQYKEKGIEFYGVFPGMLAEKEAAKNFKATYNLTFKMLKDTDFFLMKVLFARISPEVFVLNSNGIIQYQGQIDNWFFALGKKRQIVTENYLEDALNAIIENQPIKQKRTKAVGCYLPRK